MVFNQPDFTGGHYDVDKTVSTGWLPRCDAGRRRDEYATTSANNRFHRAVFCFQRQAGFGKLRCLPWCMVDEPCVAA
jgi:hypothetical protein